MKGFIIAITLLLVGFAAIAAQEDLPLRLGVLGNRPKPQAMTQWQPLADYLKSTLKRPVELKVYNHAELDAAASQRTVDVVITSAGHFIILQQVTGLSVPVATLISREGAQELGEFGGIMFTRSDRTDIASLADLSGKRIAAISLESFGGYQMQAFEMVEAGLPLPKGDQLLLTGLPQDNVFNAVIAGRVDVGFARAGILETLVKEGKVDPGRVKVINLRNYPAFPFAVSTRLYPEWPVAVMPYVDKELATRLTAALFQLPHNSLGGTATNISGFTIPANYDGVENLLRSLRQPPFDQIPVISLADLWHRYAWWIVTLGELLLLLAGASVGLVLLYRRSRQSHRELEALAAKEKLLLASLAEGVYGVDPQGNFIFMNPRALAMLGFAESEVIGKDARHLFNGQKEADSYPSRHENCPVILTLRDGMKREIEGMFNGKDGVRFPGSLAVSAMRDGDTIVGAVVAFQDITERKRAEQEIRDLNRELEERIRQRTADLQARSDALRDSQASLMGTVQDLNEKATALEAANKELEDFTYSASHDLRTPLRGIDGFSKILMDDYANKLEAEGREYLVSIRANSQRMGQLIDDMLTLPRVGRIEIRKAEVDLSALANAVVGELRNSAPERLAKFIISPGLVAHADVRLMQIALENLLDNAWKFTVNQPDALIEFGQSSQNGELAYFVRDNGIGFDMAYAQKLFGVFQKLHCPTEFPGSGIGLAIVQRIIHRHGGSIWAESATSQGATFYFTLPN